MITQKNQLTLNKVVIEARESDHFINATQLCKAGGKEFNEWYRLESTKRLINVLNQTIINENINAPTYPLSQNIDHNNENQQNKEIILVDIKRGNSSKFTQGSWVHPDLAVPLAQWISPEFSIQVSRWTRELILTGNISIDSKKSNQELIQMTKELKLKNEELNEKAKLIEQKDGEIQNTNKQLEEAKSKNLELKSEIINYELSNPNGFIYMATSKQYAQNNIFRLGRTKYLNRRMQKYQMSRVSDDEFYYIFIFRSSEVELLEHLLRNLVKKYKYDPEKNKDLYVLSSNISIPYIKSICENFQNNIINDTNMMIENNIKLVESNQKSSIPEPFIYKGDENEEEIFGTQNHHNQILEFIKNYDGVELLTAEENIRTVFDYVSIKCPHTTKEVQVRAILNSIGCSSCQKEKRIKDMKSGLQKLENFDDYDTIDIVDPESRDYKTLGVMNQNRTSMQNNIINILKKHNMALLSKYKNSDAKFKYLCSYGHEAETSWGALKRLQGNPCAVCRKLESQAQNATISSHATDQDLIKMAEDAGWKFIERIGKEGIIRWQCPNGHTIEKNKREFQRKYCGECNTN